MNSAWSDQQRRCLAALGYTLYEPVAAANAPHAQGLVPAQSAGGRAVVAFAATDQSAVDQGAPTALWHALLRAARLGPLNIADPQAWLRAQQLPSLAQLRRDPAAKRALWPILRALRRSPPP